MVSIVGPGIAPHCYLNNDQAAFGQPPMQQQQHAHPANHTAGYQPPPLQAPSQPVFTSNANYNMVQASPLPIPQSQPQANGPVVHEYNHGYNGMVNDHEQHYQHSPSQYHSQGPVQRKSKYFVKKKKKGHNHQQHVYPDSGGLYWEEGCISNKLSFLVVWMCWKRGERGFLFHYFFFYVFVAF